MKIGLKGSVSHILTNDKVENKHACLKELYKERCKDVLRLSGGAAGVAGAAAATTILLPECLPDAASKAANIVNKTKSAIGKQLSQFTFRDQNGNLSNLKEAVKSTKIYTKLSALPAPAKAAIAAGAAALPVIASFLHKASVRREGYIEGKHEVK